MELYYKDLISEETSLEKLVDDLMRVVQGADAVAEAVGATLSEHPKKKLTTRLERLKESCRKAKEQAKRSALAAGKVVRQYPYSSAGFGFAAGLLIGVAIARSCTGKSETE